MNKERIIEAVEKLEEILKVAGSLNNGNNVADKILWLEKEVDKFRHVSMRASEPSLFSVIEKMIKEKIEEE